MFYVAAALLLGQGWAFSKHSAASITAGATGATQLTTRVLERLLPPVLWSAAHSLNMAARAVLGMKRPAEGSPVI
jgi:hypothetical protein